MRNIRILVTRPVPNALRALDNPPGVHLPHVMSYRPPIRVTDLSSATPVVGFVDPATGPSFSPEQEDRAAKQFRAFLERWRAEQKQKRSPSR